METEIVKVGPIFCYKSKGEGIPLIFIHGWGMNSSVWTKQFNAFSTTHNVWGVDLRGHGLSSEANGPYTLEQFTDDLLLVINSQEIVNPILIGWSMGSMVSLKFARKFSNKISGLALVGATPRFLASADFPSGRRPAMVIRLRLNLERDYINYITEYCNHFFLTGEKIGNQAKEEIKRLMFGQSFPPPFQVVMQTLNELAEWDILQGLADIKIPTLILHGEIDNIISVVAGLELNRLIPGSTLSIFPKTGHAPFLTEPVRFNSELMEFVKNISNTYKING